jgi:hypothetical protein
VLGRQADAERDEDGTEETVEGTADLGPAEKIAGPGDGAGVGREPGECERAKDEVCPSGVNCGRRLVKKTAIFGLPRSLMMP